MGDTSTEPPFGMNASSARNTYANLRYAIECISWDADRQIAWMESCRWDSDELALQLFNDTYPVAWALRERRWLPESVDRLILAMDELFTSIEADPDRWDDSALRTDPVWIGLRKLAREALRSLPEDPAD